MDKVFIKNNKILSNLSDPLYKGELSKWIAKASWGNFISTLWNSETQHSEINLSPTQFESFLSYCENHLYNALCAGCIIENNNQFLALHKEDRLEFPKGFIDAGESMEDAAIRESQEETGLQHISLGQKLGDTYHIYQFQTDFTFKKTTWFAATTNELKVNVQKEEGFENYEWMSRAKLMKSAHLFHANMIDLVNAILH